MIKGGQIAPHLCGGLVISMTQMEDLLERKYFTGSMSLLTPNHSSKTRGVCDVEWRLQFFAVAIFIPICRYSVDLNICHC